MKTILISVLLSLIAYAGIEQAPDNFEYNGKMAVFIDFERAQYNVHYDAENKTAQSKSVIEFTQNEVGYPIFDIVPEPYSVKINGIEVEQELIETPGGVEVVRVIKEELSPGIHTLEVIAPLKRGVKFEETKTKGWNRVSSGFFMRDITTRMFMEMYLPTNFEFDQFSLSIEAKISGTKRFHTLFANGDITKFSENHYRVEYPSYSTTSSPYFHIVPINKFVRMYRKYRTIDGRVIPLTIYSNSRFHNFFLRRRAISGLRELERDYGPWPYDYVIIYGTGLKGGMEHSGATETSWVALQHELFHSYFARGVFPANGNSGWLDEGLATWRDDKYPTRSQPYYESFNLGARDQYSRNTHWDSYDRGSSFFSYIDYQLKDMGRVGLKDFMKVFFQKRKYTTYTTEDFRIDLENYAGVSFNNDFRQYIYGQSESKNTTKDSSLSIKEKNELRKKLETELDSIL